RSRASEPASGGSHRARRAQRRRRHRLLTRKLGRVSPRVATGALPALADSPLALTELRIEAGDEAACGDGDTDTLLYVSAGTGSLDLAGVHPLEAGDAAFLAAGESGVVRAESDLRIVRATVGPG